MSYRKRQNSNESGQSSKRPAWNSGLTRSVNTEDAVAKAKARLLAKQQAKSDNQGKKMVDDTKQDQTREGKGGLNVELHPLLRNIGKTPSIPKNHNPLKQNVRQWFDPAAINPYLNQSDMSVDPKLQHKPRPLQLNPQGKHIARANELRQRLKEEELERQRIEDIRLKGLLPDENLAEHLYKPQYPPIVEWWDRPYLSEMKYGSELKLDSEEAPVSIYIQHPVLIPPPWESHLSEEKAMYLTKKEMKRIRRNDRQQKHKDKQDRIKLGLDAPPPPKVKLSNLMNVLTNEAIKDPTGVEMKVKQEVEERYQKHMQENEERKLTKDEKHDKIKRQHEQDLQKGYFTTVYKVQTLQDPQHFFKVDMNAKQLDFVGVILLNPRFNLIIVEGGLKNINFYKKLMTRRIKWTQGGQLEDLSQNQCDVLWEGQLKQLHFKKWSVMHSSNDDEAYMVLNKFGCENYWREAVA